MSETGPGKDFFNKIFTDLLDKTIGKRYSRSTSLGAVYAERFIRTIRDLLKRPFFERGDANEVDVLPSITKQYFEGIHSPTKLSSIYTRNAHSRTAENLDMEVGQSCFLSLVERYDFSGRCVLSALLA